MTLVRSGHHVVATPHAGLLAVAALTNLPHTAIAMHGDAKQDNGKQAPSIEPSEHGTTRKVIADGKKAGASYVEYPATAKGDGNSRHHGRRQAGVRRATSDGGWTHN